MATNNVEIIDLDTSDASDSEIEIIENKDDDFLTAETISASDIKKFVSNIGTLDSKNQLLRIEKLRTLLHISNCSLIYNPKSSFDFNLAVEINSINLEQFKEHEESLADLIAMGNGVMQVYKECDSQSWLQHIIEQISKLNDGSSNDVDNFFRSLWDMKKELYFPSSIIELVVFTYPSVLEDFVITLVTKCSETDKVVLQNHLDEVYNDDGVKAWVAICSKCPQMFQMSSSMIQTLLHYSRGNKKLLAFAQSFHNAVRLRCNLFHTLFPVHLQPLVRRLITRTPGDDEVLHELLKLMVIERPACQALMTCFPKWLPRLLVLAVNNRVASIISEEFGDWHR